jgi:hypothetical protein
MMPSSSFRKNLVRHVILPVCLLAWMNPCPAPAQSNTGTLPRKSMSTGNYTDKKTGAKHNWQVNGAHTLLWDGAPYLPVGGEFAPRSFGASSDAGWQDDVKALELLKARGIRDLIIWPDKPLVEIPTAVLQRLIDYLDANDFRYGLSFGQGLTTPATGYVVKPNQYRYENPRELTALWQVSGVDRGLYFLVDGANDARFVRGGEATVHDGVASAPIDVPQTVAKPVALLLPHKTLTASPVGTLPDLWTHFDSYRDRVLTYLEKIKFGSGFRFYLDPLARHLGFSGEADYLVPDSDSFRVEWESYLNKTYTNAEDVKSHWLLSDDFRTIQELARLVPLWNRKRGLPYLFDPVTARVYRTQQSETLEASWWDDFLHWRDQSIGYYMNALADTLKHQVADVPVVYTWTREEALFSGSDPAAGFDGLAVATRAQDPTRLSRVTGLVYSAAEQASRTMWLIVSEINRSAYVERGHDTGVAKAQDGLSVANATGYATNREMETDLTDLRRIGMKGLFVNALQPDSGASRAIGNWSGAPESLDWLHTFASGLAADASVANFAPRVLYYPESVPSPARTMLIPGTNSVYWLPANITGKPVTLWPAFAGYVIQGGTEKSQDTVLYSLTGPRKTRIFLPDITKIQARTAEGSPIPLKILSKLSAEVTIDATPMIFTTDGEEVVPEAAAADALTQLALLNQIAHLQEQNSSNIGQPDLGDVEYKTAAMYFHKGFFGTSYAAARQMIDRMTDLVRPYIWMEGEAATAQNFTEVAPNAEASGGNYLRLSTPDPARYPVSVYAARYAFDVPNDGDYRIWIAGSLPGPETSPITWYIDRRPEQEPASPTPQGPLYLQQHFGWYQLGTARLEKGPHNLTVKVVDRAAATGQFALGIDSILVIPVNREFTPNATIRPIPIDPETARAVTKTRPRKQQGKSKSP